MDMSLHFLHSQVGKVAEGPVRPEPVALSVEGLRNCFPGRLVIVINGEKVTFIEDAPLLGALVEVSALWKQIQQGAMTAEAVDFYGEYKLVINLKNGLVVLSEEFSGIRVCARRDEFVAAVRTWATALLSELEHVYPALTQNPNYARLKTSIETTWSLKNGSA